jgi:hypothetical protein
MAQRNKPTTMITEYYNARQACVVIPSKAPKCCIDFDLCKTRPIRTLGPCGSLFQPITPYCFASLAAARPHPVTCLDFFQRLSRHSSGLTSGPFRPASLSHSLRRVQLPFYRPTAGSLCQGHQFSLWLPFYRPTQASFSKATISSSDSTLSSNTVTCQRHPSQRSITAGELGACDMLNLAPKMRKRCGERSVTDLDSRPISHFF